MSDGVSSASFPAVLRDGTNYPHQVRPYGSAFYVAVIIFGVAATLLIIGAIATWLTLPPANAEWVELMLVVYVAFVAYQLWLLASPNVVLYVDRIEQRDVLGRWRSIPRSQIVGINKAQGRYGSYLKVVVAPDLGRPIALPRSAQNDPVVKEWTAGAVDAAKQAAEVERATILADPRYGASEAERKARLKLAGVITLTFSAISFGAAVWIYYFRQPVWLFLAAPIVAPLIAFALVRSFDGLIVIIGTTSVRPQIGFGAIAPPIAAGWAILNHNNLEDVSSLAIPASAVGLAVGAWIFATQRPQITAPAMALFAGVAAGLGLFGVAVQANETFDHTHVRPIPTAVLSKEYSRGRYAIYYTLVLAGANGQAGRRVDVSSNLYSVVNSGAVVCVARQPGAFDAPWVRVGLCPGSLSKLPGSDVLSRFYPERAMREGKTGQVAINCRVTASLTFDDCRVVSENPPGYGFGDAALQLMQKGGLNLKSVPPSGRFYTKVTFQLPR